MLRARIALALALFSTACTDFDEGGHHHSHRVENRNMPAELPRLPSTALRYEKHLDFDSKRRVSFLTGPRRLEQRVLLLTANGGEPSFLHAKEALDRIGIPYHTVNVSQTQITDSLLTEAPSTCKYNAVIFSTSGLDGHLDADEAGRIATYEVQCSAREVVWYAWPSAELGLAPAVTGGVQTMNASVADATFFNRVKSTASIPYRLAWGYPATIVDPTKTTALLRDNNGNVVLAKHVDAGREILVSTVDNSPYLTHSMVLEYDMLRWATRGLFIGKKRAYMSNQIDDIFLENDMWQINVGNIDSSIDPANARTFRINGADVSTFVTWQTGLQARLPAGSTFITDMAFNGWGTTAAAQYEGTLLTASRAAGNKLTWLNHTWDHDNMDAMSRTAARNEISNNCNRARTLQLFGFECSDLVTPDMSGLQNINAVRGMIDAGVRYIVSDTSHTEALFPNAPGDNPSFNVGRVSTLDSRLYHIPRHPTSVFYDVETPATHVDEYNFIYRSYWGRDLSYEEVVDKASEFGFVYLLQGDIDPLMFHQANLHDYGGGKSLYGDFVDAVVNKYLALSPTPILTLSQVAIGEAMKARAKLNACNASLTIVETSLATRSLFVKSTAGCVIPVTGLDKALYGAVETYNGEKTTSIAMPSLGGTIAIPL
jgi:hypothetical protein